MAATDDVVIWRATSAANNTETLASAANTLGLNEAVVSATGGYVFTSEIFYRNAVPENPKILGRINEVQDMGLDGIDIQLTGFIKDSDSNTKIINLVTWLKEDKSLSDLPKGRFGLRIDRIPSFNVEPKNDPDGFGYVLADVRFIQNQKTFNVDLVITLRFSGDIVGLGTP